MIDRAFLRLWINKPTTLCFVERHRNCQQSRNWFGCKLQTEEVEGGKWFYIVTREAHVLGGNGKCATKDTTFLRLPWNIQGSPWGQKTKCVSPGDLYPHYSLSPFFSSSRDRKLSPVGALCILRKLFMHVMTWNWLPIILRIRGDRTHLGRTSQIRQCQKPLK